MEELVALEISLHDWAGYAKSSLYYQRGVRTIEAHDAIAYAWDTLGLDDRIDSIFSRYITEYAFHYTESLDEGNIDNELLDDVFRAICLEYFTTLECLSSDYNFEFIKLSIEGLYHYLLSCYSLTELETRVVTDLYRDCEQLYVGIGNRHIPF